jgi:hypothetical protein
VNSAWSAASRKATRRPTGRCRRKPDRPRRAPPPISARGQPDGAHRYPRHAPPVDALQHNLHECIGVEGVAECVAQAASDRGRQPLRVAAGWWRFRLHGWVIQRSCGGHRLAASAPVTRRTPGGSPDVENTAQPGVRRLSTLLAMNKVAVGYRPSVAMVG